MIIQAKRNCKGKQWVAYDRQFWKEALMRKDVNWSIRLYTMEHRSGSVPSY